MIRCLDQLDEKLEKETIVILDNTPWHRSKAFMAKLQEWQTKDLYIFHLPSYSPHLNLIETLWRKIKYEWLRPKDYNSKTALKKRLKEILTTFGQQFEISFSMNIYQ